MRRWLVILLLVFGSVVCVLPFYLMLSMSLKSLGEISTNSPWSLPSEWRFENYRDVLQNPNLNFYRFFGNTVTVALLSTVGAALSASVVAYGFARIRFRGRDKLFVLLLSTMMIPSAVTLIPTYIMFSRLGWVNTFNPLIVPAWFGGGAFNVFLVRQYMLGIPRELDEAAVLDGARHPAIYWRVILPLCGPVMATVCLFSFIASWKDFLGPMLYLNETNKQTLEVGLSTYNSVRGSEWHYLMAGSVIVCVPLIALFLFGQRYFVRGIALTGGKG